MMRRRLARRSQWPRPARRRRTRSTRSVRRRRAARTRAICWARRGAAWLAELALPVEEREMLDSALRQVDCLTMRSRSWTGRSRTTRSNWPEARRLMTLPGVNLIVAVTFLAAFGDIHRFPNRRNWSPTWAWIRRSASPATRPPVTAGSPSKAPRPRATRWSRPVGAPSVTPGPLHAFYQRVRSRRGHQVAIVAASRKLARLFSVLLWREQDTHRQPSLTAKKLGQLEITAGATPAVSRAANRALRDARTRPRPPRRARQRADRPRPRVARGLNDCCASPERRAVGVTSGSAPAGVARSGGRETGHSRGAAAGTFVMPDV